MNCLLLLDLVPNFHPFLVRLGNALERRGHTVSYALETPLNNHRYREHAVSGRVRVFSEFLASRTGEVSLEQAARVGTWESFFSDFDRYEHYGVNHGRRQEWYARLASALNEFFLNCLRDWKIDAVIYEGITNSFAWFANQAAQQTGAAFLGVGASRLPGRHEIPGGCEEVLRQRVRAAFEALAAGQLQPDATALDWVARYLDKFDQAIPDYMVNNKLALEDPLTRYGRSRHLRTLWRLATYQMQGNSPARTSYRSGPPLTYSLIHIRISIARWLRAKFLARFFTPSATGDRFYFYPMHFHPESSTSVDARWYVDEYPVIKNLAFSLPFGAWLYVKDHLSAVGYPPIDFYRRVSRLPNVRLIHPAANTKELVRESEGVITLTSTVGYEALVLRKPVWVLGNPFYDFHPGCVKIGWTDDLPAILARPRQKSVTEDDAHRLVLAYYLSTHPGSLPIDGERPGTAPFDQLVMELEAATRKQRQPAAVPNAGLATASQLGRT